MLRNEVKKRGGVCVCVCMHVFVCVMCRKKGLRRGPDYDSHRIRLTVQCAKRAPSRTDTDTSRREKLLPRIGVSLNVQSCIL